MASNDHVTMLQRRTIKTKLSILTENSRSSKLVGDLAGWYGNYAAPIFLALFARPNVEPFSLERACLLPLPCHPPLQSEYN